MFELGVFIVTLKSIGEAILFACLAYLILKVGALIGSFTRHVRKSTKMLGS